MKNWLKILTVFVVLNSGERITVEHGEFVSGPFAGWFEVRGMNYKTTTMQSLARFKASEVKAIYAKCSK
jgi:hypothetical protein